MSDFKVEGVMYSTPHSWEGDVDFSPGRAAAAWTSCDGAGLDRWGNHFFVSAYIISAYISK